MALHWQSCREDGRGIDGSGSALVLVDEPAEDVAPTVRLEGFEPYGTNPRAHLFFEKRRWD